MADVPAKAKRGRGAPKGNRNAWKHGKRSAGAKAARDVARERVMAGLPDAGVFVQIAQRHEPQIKRLGWDAELACILSSKTNNSAARQKEGEADSPSANFSENKTNNSVPGREGGGDPSILSRNKTNNSVAPLGKPKRGAPQGNKNALKHGSFSGKRREFNSGLRHFLRRVDAMCRLANAMASAGSVR